MSVIGRALPFGPAAERGHHVDDPGRVRHKSVAEGDLVAWISADVSGASQVRKNVGGREAILAPRFRETPVHGVLLAVRPVVAGMRESVAWSGGGRIESDRLDSHRIHQAGRDAVAWKCVANKTCAIG